MCQTVLLQTDLIERTETPFNVSFSFRRPTSNLRNPFDFLPQIVVSIVCNRHPSAAICSVPFHSIPLRFIPTNTVLFRRSILFFARQCRSQRCIILLQPPARRAFSSCSWHSPARPTDFGRNTEASSPRGKHKSKDHNEPRLRARAAFCRRLLCRSGRTFSGTRAAATAMVLPPKRERPPSATSRPPSARRT